MIRNLGALKSGLARVERKLTAGFDRAVDETTEAVAGDARQFAPVDEGELRASIEPRTTDEGGEVVATADHAAYVEFGTSNMSAQPYMLPAAEIARTKFVQAVKKAAKEAT